MIVFVILAAAFVSGAIAGAIVLLRLGIAREESDHSLHGKPPTLAAAAARRVLGWHAAPRRMPVRAGCPQVPVGD